MMERKEYTVTIFGQKHSIVSDEREQNIVLIEKEIDKIYSSLSSQGNVFTDQQLVVLSTLRLANEMVSSQTRCQDYESAITDIIALINAFLCTNGSAE